MPVVAQCPTPDCGSPLHLTGDIETTRIDTAGATHIEGGYAGVIYVIACSTCHKAISVVPEPKRDY